MADALVAFVIGAKPRVTETAAGTIISIPLSRRAFVIQAGTNPPEFLGREAVTRALEAARRKDVNRLDHGAYDILVYGDALGQVDLVDTLAKVLSSPGGVVTVAPAGHGLWGRLWQRMRLWMRVGRGAKLVVATPPPDPRRGGPGAVMPVPERSTDQERVA